MRITVNCENRNRRRKVDLSKAKKVAETVLKTFGKKDAVVNIVFISNQKIRALNRMYLGKDSSTDVLAFPSGDTAGLRSQVSGLRKGFLGDVAISSDKAAGNAGEYGTAFKEEIALYVIHGVLHLLGYDDRTKKSRKVLQRKEHELLQKAKAVI